MRENKIDLVTVKEDNFKEFVSRFNGTGIMPVGVFKDGSLVGVGLSIHGRKDVMFKYENYSMSVTMERMEKKNIYVLRGKALAGLITIHETFTEEDKAKERKAAIEKEAEGAELEVIEKEVSADHFYMMEEKAKAEKQMLERMAEAKSGAEVADAGLPF